MTDIPKIISVDDHVVEPADVWQKRLPKKYLDVGPRVVRAPLGEMTFVGGNFSVRSKGEGNPLRLVALRGQEDPADAA